MEIFYFIYINGSLASAENCDINGKRWCWRHKKLVKDSSDEECANCEGTLPFLPLSFNPKRVVVEMVVKMASRHFRQCTAASGWKKHSQMMNVLSGSGHRAKEGEKAQ